MADASGAVDLGGAPKHAGNAPEAPQVAPSEEAEREVIDTAFTVVVTTDGQCVVTPYDGDQFLLQRNPTPSLVEAYLSLALSNMVAQKIAETTVATQFERAQQMQAQIAQQQQAAQIAQGLDLSKLRS